MKKFYVIIIIVGLGASFAAISAESLLNYKEEMQRIFVREAANKDNFTKAVQTARLLGYLEFMEPESFSGFHQCMSKEKNWDYLNAKKREQVLNSCRGQGRSISGITSTPSAPAVSPAASQKQEQEMNSLRRDMNDLRNMIEKLTTEIRNNHDRMVETLNQFSRAPQSIQPPQQAMPQAPEGAY
ncbi:MAG: hypothetical protein A3G92_01280 [Deltaproteobacteria bacterium RIFCSPLOWO2_12_FULL_38_8]|nr:MAG: hypothetical protein A3G92_01280 [Deltaproteobacteria bacterium RIFCSPLOWO2_12_FULL_38_8]